MALFEFLSVYKKLFDLNCNYSWLLFPVKLNLWRSPRKPFTFYCFSTLAETDYRRFLPRFIHPARGQSLYPNVVWEFPGFGLIFLRFKSGHNRLQASCLQRRSISRLKNSGGWSITNPDPELGIGGSESGGSESRTDGDKPDKPI